MLDYILGGLSFSEANIEAIWKFLRRQKRINNRLSVVAVGMVVYIVRAEIRGAIQRSSILILSLVCAEHILLEDL